MSEERCQEMRLLLQADMDGELTPADAARIAAHLDGCARCSEAQDQLAALSARLRRELRYHPAPAPLHESIRAAVRNRPASAPPEPRSRPGRIGGFTGFGASLALAACLVLAIVLPQRAGSMADTVVAEHIRALQPGHLMDVISTDQHTVKPWFDGRLDYAPPVRDFQAAGFALAGARLDYLAGRPVAALVYQRRQHSIDLFVWPTGEHFDRGPAEGSRNGYNFAHWSQDGQAYWAVSDLNPAELSDFVKLWRG